MRLALAASALAVPLASLFAVAPPAAPPAEVRADIGRLASPDWATRRAALAKLQALDEELIPALRAAAREQADPDVQLRLVVAARAIRERGWGQLKALGPGAALTARPPFGGYWLNRVQFSRDGKYAVAAGGGLILYDLQTGKEANRVLEVGGARPGLAVSRDGKHALTGHASTTLVHLVELPALRVVRTFTGHTGGIYAVALSPDGDRAASASADRTVCVWDVRSGKLLHRFAPFAQLPGRVAFSPDGKRLLTGQAGVAGEPLVRLWDVATGKQLRGFTGHAGVQGVAFRPDGRTFVSVGGEAAIRVWDVDTGRVLRSMSHGAAVNDLAVSPDGRRALTAGFGDSTVKVWDLERGRLEESFTGHLGAVLGVAFSPDGRRALSCDSVCCVRLWKLGR